MITIGNAPCSWGVEFAGDPRNPPWTVVLEQCARAGYLGIELGPIGYMPEDAFVAGEALARFGLTLIGGVVFRPFHDPSRWAEVRDAAVRTCRALRSNGAEHLVLIDSIATQRASTAGRPEEAKRMSADEWRGFIERIERVARIGVEEYGLTVSIQSHAGDTWNSFPRWKACWRTSMHPRSGFAWIRATAGTRDSIPSSSCAATMTACATFTSRTSMQACGNMSCEIASAFTMPALKACFAGSARGKRTLRRCARCSWTQATMAGAPHRGTGLRSRRRKFARGRCNGKPRLSQVDRVLVLESFNGETQVGHDRRRRGQPDRACSSPRRPA